jgi:hypothetical protein
MTQNFQLSAQSDWTQQFSIKVNEGFFVQVSGNGSGTLTSPQLEAVERARPTMICLCRMQRRDVC